MTAAIRDALEGMVWQFASRTMIDGRRALSTMGLSALEEAFEALGWDDPHFTDFGGCEIDGCEQWANSTGSYPRSCGKPEIDPAKVGFGFLCSRHWVLWNHPGHRTEPDLGRKNGS